MAERATEVQVLNDQASALVRQGLEILDDGTAGAPERALACFDRALALRHQLPTASDPWLRFDLAGTWLNRASALIRTGDPARTADAQRAHDAALDLLQTLPLSLDPAFPRRLAIAYQNRGLARFGLRADDGAGAAAATADFVRALDVLHAHEDPGTPDWPCLVGAVALSAAQAQAHTGSSTGIADALAFTWRALGAVRRHESIEVAAAEVGLLARHVLCRLTAGRLEQQAAGGEAVVNDDVHTATDAVEEGLALVAHWEQRGAAQFRSLAADLLRFGALVYARYQPHFFDEFVNDHTFGDGLLSRLGDSAEMRAALDDVTGRPPRVSTPLV